MADLSRELTLRLASQEETGMIMSLCYSCVSAIGFPILGLVSVVTVGKGVHAWVQVPCLFLKEVVVEEAVRFPSLECSDDK